MSPLRSVLRLSPLTGLLSGSRIRWQSGIYSLFGEYASRTPALRPSFYNLLCIQHTLSRPFHQTRPIAEQSHENEANNQPQQTPTKTSQPQQPQPNPICDICRINPTTEHIPSQEFRVGRSFWDKNWTSFCNKCYKNYAAGRKVRRKEMNNELASRKERVAKMLEEIQSIESPERVPVNYAKEKLQEAARSTKFFRKPRRQYQKRIKSELWKVFDIRKGPRGLTCMKARVDAMDWTLWCLYPYLDVDL